MTRLISNALGKVIFLGTPLYYKQWAKWAALKMLFSLLVSFVLGFVLTWCAVGLWNGVINKRADRNIVVYISLGLSGAIFLANLPTLFANMRFGNGNIYHSDKVPRSPAQHALVIQAGKLDEAALALCAEPAARAFLLPLVRRATAHVGFLPLPARPAARTGARSRALAWSLYLLALFRVVVLDAYLLVPRVLFWLISKVVVMHTFAMVRNVVVGMSFGLDTSNLKNASVYVEEALVLGKGARDIRTWDVRRLLAEAEAGAASQSWGADALGSRGVGEKGLGGQGLGKQKLGGKGLSDSGLGERELGDQTAQSLTGRRSDDVAQGGDGGERGAVGSNGRFAPESGSEGGCPTGSEKVVQTGMLPEIEKSGSDAATFQRASGPNAGGSKSKTTDQGGLVKGVQEGPQASESAFSFLWDDDELRTRSDTSVMFNQLRSQMPRIDHSPRLSRAEFARELRSICCVFEMRFWEIRNHFQLAHATYYKNSVIVGAMVRFLNDLELPSEHY